MTGVFDRLRAWLGSFFGEGAVESDADDDGSTEPGPRFEGSEPTVVHRDDRPLETTDTLPGDADDLQLGGATDSTDTDTVAADLPDVASDFDPDAVSIPDAEAVGTDGTAAEAPAPGAAESDAGKPDDADTVSVDDADAFVCSVCGTTVDEPVETCPLCHSSDVKPVDDGPSGG